MATALFTVTATITPEREKAFNEWYNHEHIPDARRYKDTQPEDRSSEHMTFLRQEYDRNFGGVSDRQRATYVQVWP